MLTARAVDIRAFANFVDEEDIVGDEWGAKGPSAMVHRSTCINYEFQIAFVYVVRWTTGGEYPRDGVGRHATSDARFTESSN